MKTCQRRFAALVCLSVSTAAVHAQQNRIAGAIDSSRRVTLAGHVPPRARRGSDLGPVAGGFQLPSLMLVLKPSAGQQSALTALLSRQQDPGSPDYHNWLTPEQYADQFGASQSDIGRIEAWLQSQGFTVLDVGRGRTSISFSGTAAQAQGAFQTQIHSYRVDGVAHFANAADPSVPAVLAPLVTSIRGLNDFHPKPHARLRSTPLNTSGGFHTLVPDDIATIYDIAPLYSAGIDGTGQSLVVVGQTALGSPANPTADIDRFRSKYGLPAINLTQVLAQRTSPGISSGDLPEADLDIEWSGAVARNANIIYVYSNDVFTSAFYAIQHNLAKVMTISYGICEQADLIELPGIQQFAQQANAQGITWFAASGDLAAADCDLLFENGETSAPVAQNGLAVDAPASIPEVTAMGGTEFNEQGGTYWSSINTATGASALSYIPEKAWNDTALVGVLLGGGGGASTVFPQPVWQTGPGVPNDGARHVPDLSFASSPNHDGYNIVTGGVSEVIGGTSAAAPLMAGVTALLNQYLVQNNVIAHAGLGNINPTLYRLAQSSPGVFHDVTAGDNIVPCAGGTPDCTGGSLGYSAQTGYDQATGLGSVDVNNFVRGWASAQPPPRAAPVPSIFTSSCSSPSVMGAGTSSIQTCSVSPLFQFNGGWQFKITLTEEAGVAATLTNFTIDGASYTSQISTLFGGASIPADGSISAQITLTGVAVPKKVVFAFSGTDASNNAWSTQMSVPFAGPQPQLTIAGVSNAASGQTLFAPGMLVAVYGTGLGSFVQPAAAIPLPQYLAGFEAFINGNPCPLYYVSPNQVNLQIPYETALGPATLTVGNPFDNLNYTLMVTQTAPGIFMLADGSVNPSRTAARGQETFLFVTGDGQVTPSLNDGTTPSANTPLFALPKPRQQVTITIGGVAIPESSFDFIGITPGLVGVTQINFHIPANVPTGPQQVVVTVGTQSSNTATITVQ